MNCSRCCTPRCCTPRCCTPRVQITGYTTTTTFNLLTSYSFANAKNCDSFFLDLTANTPSLSTIVPVSLLSSSGAPAAMPLICSKTGNNVMSDQLVGVRRILVRFGNNPNHLLVLKAFDNCGCEICLRKSAFYATFKSALVVAKTE